MVLKDRCWHSKRFDPTGYASGSTAALGAFKDELKFMKITILMPAIIDIHSIADVSGQPSNLPIRRYMP